VDRPSLILTEKYLKLALDNADSQIQLDLGCPGLNIDANEDLADALDKAKKITAWSYTEKGKRSTAREAMIHNLNDPILAHFLAYRGQLATVLNTFITPWIELSEKDGRLHPNWHQVRTDFSTGGGTRTGRLSSSGPNLQNVPKEFKTQPPPGYPELPNMRSFLLPEEGELFVSADFHSQELRILGHFAEGTIQKIYQADPHADVIEAITKIVKGNTGRQIDRKATKVVIYSMLYGAGNRKIGATLGIIEDEARELVSVILDAMSGVRELRRELQEHSAANKTARTWGGRVIRAPKGADGSRRDYALLNYLIQGSAADQTKQAMVDYHRTKKNGVFLATVHDEICISVKPEHLKEEVALLRAAMEGGKFDIPMRAEVTVGPNWGHLPEKA
jgi:DNA polymerase-1